MVTWFVICIMEASGKIRIFAPQIGNDTVAAALELSPDTSLEVIAKEMDEANNKDPKFRTALDRAFKSALDSYTNRINKYETVLHDRTHSSNPK